MSKAKKARRAPAPNRPTAVFPPSRYDIATVFGLIEALDGMQAVADDLGVTFETVKEWAISGDIPPGWHLRIFGKVCAMGKTISPTVFGFREGDESAIALTRLMMAERSLIEGGAHG